MIRRAILSEFWPYVVLAAIAGAAFLIAGLMR